MSPEQILSYANTEYALQVEGAELVRESSDNQIWKLVSKRSHQGYFLRISKRDLKEDIAFEATWLEVLAKDGVPVAPLVKTYSGEPFSISEFGATTLFKEVFGTHLNFDKENFPNKEQIASAAKALARIHQASSSVATALPRQRTIFTELSRVESIKDNLNLDEPGNSEFLSGISDSLAWAKSQQFEPVLIHNDYRIGNLLFEGDEVAAVLDFDWSCMGPAIKDVAHALAEWSYPDGADTHNESVFAAFLDSYNTVAKNPIARNKTLYQWIAFSCISDAATFVVDRIERGQPKLPRQSYMFSKYRHFKGLAA